MSKKIAEILKEQGIEFTDDQIKSIEAEHLENYRSIEEVKNKDEKLTSKDKEIEELKGQVQSLNESVEGLTGDNEQLDELKSQLADFQKKEEERQKLEAEATKRKTFEMLFDAAVGEKKFVNDMTRDAIFEKAYEKCSSEAGISADVALASITENMTGIWENPQNNINNMPAGAAGDENGGTPIKTIEDVKRLTPKQINENWDAVSKLLAKQEG